MLLGGGLLPGIVYSCSGPREQSAGAKGKQRSDPLPGMYVRIGLAGAVGPTHTPLLPNLKAPQQSLI